MSDMGSKEKVDYVLIGNMSCRRPLGDKPRFNPATVLYTVRIYVSLTDIPYVAMSIMFPAIL